MGNPKMPPLLIAPGMLANESVCYSSTMVTTNGIWVKEDPMNYSLPTFLLQVLLMVVTTRLFMLFLKPLNLSRLFCELIAGIILGPSVLGNVGRFGPYIFSKQSQTLLETIANIGVIYFAFMIGLDTELSLIREHRNKALSFALTSILPPFFIASAFSFSIRKLTTLPHPQFTLLFASALSFTSLPFLSRTLAELRILDVHIGKLAKSTAFFNEIIGLVILVFVVSSTEAETTLVTSSALVILCSVIFAVFCALAVRPLINWLVKRSSQEGNFGELTTSVVVAGVMFSTVIADVIGVHPTFGAFVFGVAVPKGSLSIALTEKLEDIVTGFLLPLFVMDSGLKTNVAKIKGVSNWVMLMSAVLLSVAGRVAGTVFVGKFFEMPASEGAALGLLMNSVGLIQLFGLNIGKDQKVIDDTAYAIMVVSAIVMNGIISPVVVKTFKPARKFVPYKRRTIQKTKADSELRILACVHIPRNVPTLINLLEASQPSKKFHMSVFSLHLVELTGRASATIIYHNSQKSSEPNPALNRYQAQSDHIINAFETYRQNNGNVSVHSMTAISPYSTMHEEICNLAEEKRVAFVVVPFHKQQTVEGGMETANPQFRMVNQNLLANAPCSVGILIDRGLKGNTRSSASSSSAVSHHIVLLFFGGPDDREALSYAVRMLQHPQNSLDVIRFVPGPDADLMIEPMDDLNESLTLQIDKEKDKQLDDDYVKELLMMTKVNGERFTYVEKVVNNGEETVAAIRSVTNMVHDLFIVGRGDVSASPLTSGLTEWSEFPELGVIGDLLASADFAATVSVLVVQQYLGLGVNDQDGMSTPESASQQEEDYILDRSYSH